MEITLSESWEEGRRNEFGATKGNLYAVVEAARTLGNGGALSRARAVRVLTGVHKSRTDDPERVPPDWHPHVTVLVTLHNGHRETWHINVYAGRKGFWDATSIFRYPGQRHFEQQPGDRLVHD